MAELLDDHKFEIKPTPPDKPDKGLSILSGIIFLGLFITQISMGYTSESKLVFGSYFWMPFLVTSFFGTLVPPKRAILLGVLTVPCTFIFYAVIWPAL